MIYSFDGRDPIVIKQELYYQLESLDYYTHHLTIDREPKSQELTRQLILRGFLVINNPYGVYSTPALTPEGVNWLTQNGIQYHERRRDLNYSRHYRIEVATREQATFLKLAWG